MAQTKVSKRNLCYLAWLLVLVGIVVAVLMAMQPGGEDISWQAVKMDGHRTGAVCITQENVNTALGVFEDDEYVAPNGESYYDLESPVPEAAAILMEVQPQLAYLKEVVGHSARMMDNARALDGPLSNLFVDVLRDAGSKYFKVPMDFAITNYGGIRVPMPEGAITLDDITSMFPFKNYMCYVKMQGSELTRLLEQLAETEAFQAVSGAKVRVKGHKLESALIGGQPIDPNRVYNVTTIDFLLNGGDGLRIGAMALDLKLSRVLLRDVMLDYIRDCESKGILIDSAPDGRVIMED